MGQVFTSYISGKGLVSRLFKELKLLNIKKTNDPVKKWGMEQNRDFSKDKNKCLKNILKKKKKGQL